MIQWNIDGIFLPVIKHGWLENPISMEDFIGKSLISDPFFIAIFDYRGVSFYSVVGKIW